MKPNDRREFLKKAAVVGASGMIIPAIVSCGGKEGSSSSPASASTPAFEPKAGAAPLIVPANNG